MGTVKPDELLKLWALEEVSVEMAIDYTLQNLVKIQTSVEALTRSLYNLQSDVSNLIAQVGLETKSRGKKSS
jgi:hypothetical protein